LAPFIREVAESLLVISYPEIPPDHSVWITFRPDEPGAGR
jgi:hypothetical protein